MPPLVAPLVGTGCGGRTPPGVGVGLSATHAWRSSTHSCTSPCLGRWAPPSACSPIPWGTLCFGFWFWRLVLCSNILFSGSTGICFRLVGDPLLLSFTEVYVALSSFLIETTGTVRALHIVWIKGWGWGWRQRFPSLHGNTDSPGSSDSVDEILMFCTPITFWGFNFLFLGLFNLSVVDFSAFRSLLCRVKDLPLLVCSFYTRRFMF